MENKQILTCSEFLSDLFDPEVELTPEQINQTCHTILRQLADKLKRAYDARLGHDRNIHIVLPRTKITQKSRQAILDTFTNREYSVKFSDKNILEFQFKIPGK